MRVVVLVLAALALVAPAASAQVPVQCTPPDLSIDPTTVRLQPGQNRVFNVTLTNPNPVQADASLAFAGPPGFAVTPPTATERAVAGSNGRVVVSVTVAALETATVGQTGQFQATATLACGGLQQATSGSGTATSEIAVIAVPPTPVDNLLAWARSPAVLALGGLGLVVIVGAVALKQRREGFVVTCGEPQKRVRAGRGTSFPIEVHNRAGSSDTAVFKVSEVPDGWTAFTALPELQIGPRESRTVWLMVRAPASAAPGAVAEVRLRTTSRAHPQREGELLVVAEVGSDEPGSGGGEVSP